MQLQVHHESSRRNTQGFQRAARQGCQFSHRATTDVPCRNTPQWRPGDGPVTTTHSKAKRVEIDSKVGYGEQDLDSYLCPCVIEYDVLPSGVLGMADDDVFAGCGLGPENQVLGASVGFGFRRTPTRWIPCSCICEEASTLSLEVLSIEIPRQSKPFPHNQHVMYH